MNLALPHTALERLLLGLLLTLRNEGKRRGKKGKKRKKMPDWKGA